MKTLLNIALAAALTSSSMALQAGERKETELAGCEAELQAYFGQGAEFQLVDRRRNAHGTKLRVAARLDADNAYFATCWVPKNDIAALEYDSPGQMLAGSPSSPMEPQGH